MSDLFDIIRNITWVDVKAELKVNIILKLAEYKYPPVTQDEVYKEVLEQVENFRKYSE